MNFTDYHVSILSPSNMEQGSLIGSSNEINSQYRNNVYS